MDLKTIDLNLLVAFDAMIERRSVTLAGEAIGLSQPAMSAALNRLRATFDDPLFVRAGQEMKPTPRATELAAPIRLVMQTVHGEILQRSAFDPSVTERAFTLITPDIGEVYFIPRLLKRFAAQAPTARLRAITRPPQAAAEALEAGAADLAVGYFPDLHRTGFVQQKLFDNTHVCIVRHDHPAAARRLTMKEYLAATHAVVRPDGREHVFEQFVRQRGLQLNVLVELSHFMSLLPVIENSDLIATVPIHLAHVCQNYAKVRIVEMPIKSPVIAVHQFWHRRVHKDPANIWLRQLLHAALSEEGRAGPEAERPPGH
ncbi:MAG TPA: LysR family transcriptional regulator [Variovorax sp.]